MDTTIKDKKANQRVMTAKMDAWKEGTEACVGKLEVN
jgi:hypothetical protein